MYVILMYLSDIIKLVNNWNNIDEKKCCCIQKYGISLDISFLFGVWTKNKIPSKGGHFDAMVGAMVGFNVGMFGAGVGLIVGASVGNIGDVVGASVGVTIVVGYIGVNIYLLIIIQIILILKVKFVLVY